MPASRWIELYATSPSGKTLFVCRMCGRISPVPDRTCPARPEVCHKMPLACELIEEIELALAEEQDNPDRWERDEKGNDARVLVIGADTSITPNGRRTYVNWSTRTERWLSTELYLEREEDNKNG